MIALRDFGPASPWWEAVLELDQRHMPQPWGAELWQQLTAQDRLFLWGEAHQLQGFALFRLSPWEQMAHLLKLVVRPEVRGQVEVRQFCAFQDDQLRDEQINRVYLEVSVENARALGFYHKLGFRDLRRISHFYSNGDDALTMERPI